MNLRVKQSDLVSLSSPMAHGDRSYISEMPLYVIFLSEHQFSHLQVRSLRTRLLVVLVL